MTKVSRRWHTRHDGTFGPPRHWYKITEFYCPQCGRSTEHRERVYSFKERGRKVIEAWDGCDW